jgi:hypothetical protein
MALPGRRVSVTEKDLTDMLVQQPCDKCGSAMQAAAPLSEGSCWSMQLTCGGSACNEARQFSNDPEPRVHLVHSAGTDGKLLERGKKDRAKRGAEVKDEEKEGTKDSNRRGRGVKLFNLRSVASALLTGQTYTQYQTGGVLSGEARVNRRTWERYAGRIWTAAETVTRDHFAACIRYLCDLGEPIKLSADGAWNKRVEAMMNCLALLCEELPIWIVCLEKTVYGEKDGKEYEVRPGTYEGSSKGMEPAAWERVAAELDAIDSRFRNLVRSVCVDRDGSVTTILQVPAQRAVACGMSC